MTEAALSDLYRDYIACLNRQDWANLHEFVRDDVRHNGRPFGLIGYRAMLERDFAEIPDLHFNIELMVCEPPYVASRLRFDCRPKGLFLGLPVNGKRVAFAENVFYRFRAKRSRRCGRQSTRRRSRLSFDDGVDARNSLSLLPFIGVPVIPVFAQAAASPQKKDPLLCPSMDDEKGSPTCCRLDVPSSRYQNSSSEVPR
jgi:predicted ester cyclase